METQSLVKKAALAIRDLLSQKESLEGEIESLQQEMKKLAKAKDLTMKLYGIGAFPLEDFEERFNEFSQKTASELETFEKAAELVNTGSFNFNLGTLSDTPQSSGSAEDRFIYSLIDD